MRFQNPHYISPLEKRKVKEIKELVAQKLNPLHVTQISDGASYAYSIRDISNFFEQTHKSFDLIVR